MIEHLRKFRHRIWLIGIIALPVVTLGLLRDLTIEDLVDDAEWIVVGQVEAMDSQWNDSRDIIHTYLTLSVDEYLKNPLDESELTIQIPGGVADEVELRVSDTPEFEVGETVVLFLFDRGGYMWVYGWEKGKYTVKDGMVVELGIAYEDFREQIITIQQQGVVR